jgi:nicotinate-nucleotide adenylyltransferase
MMNKTAARLTGILGGTFDPIHYGHLRVAEEIAEMTGLEEMRFVPAAIPRLRCPPVATIQHRVAMVRLAIQDNSRFALDEREAHRSGVSYSIDSLRELKQELGENVIRLCHFIIAARPGHALVTALDTLPLTLKEECAQRWVSNADELGNASCGLVFIAPTTLLDISATRIRACVAAGKSVRYLLPDTALNYIAANQLYSGDR